MEMTAAQQRELDGALMQLCADTATIPTSALLMAMEAIIEAREDIDPLHLESHAQRLSRRAWDMGRAAHQHAMKVDT